MSDAKADNEQRCGITMSDAKSKWEYSHFDVLRVKNIRKNSAKSEWGHIHCHHCGEDDKEEGANYGPQNPQKPGLSIWESLREAFWVRLFVRHAFNHATWLDGGGINLTLNGKWVGMKQSKTVVRRALIICPLSGFEPNLPPIWRGHFEAQHNISFCF